MKFQDWLNLGIVLLWTAFFIGVVTQYFAGQTPTWIQVVCPTVTLIITSFCDFLIELGEDK